MKAVILGAILATVLAASAHALTASEVYHDCKLAPNDPDAIVSCTAYMRGLMDGLDFASAMESSGNRYCAPENMDLTQFELVVIREMEAHPENLNAPAGITAGIALYKAFRCKR